MATAFLPGVVLPSRDDGGCGAAKRARDGDLLTLLEEADARGWSSAVWERTLALRRRRGPASISSTRGCGWVAAATGDELGCRCEEAATPDAIGAGAAAEEMATVDPSCIAYSKRDVPSFDPPPMAPMAMPLLPLCVFIADLWNNGGVDKRARELIGRPEEAATPGAVGAFPAAAEETVMDDPYLSYFCLTL